MLVVRSARPGRDVIATVQQEVARLNPDLPVYGVRSMREVVARSPGLPVRQVLTAAFAGFALLAVVLGALGLFGVAAHDVAARRAELALRIALGAHPAGILKSVLGQGGVMSRAARGRRRAQSGPRAPWRRCCSAPNRSKFLTIGGARSPLLLLARPPSPNRPRRSHQSPAGAAVGVTFRVPD